MKEALKAFWENRRESDRLAIRVLAAAITLAITYTYAWLPVVRDRDRLLMRVPELRKDAQAMELDIREWNRLQPAARAKGDLQAAIQDAAKASALATAPIQISADGALRARVAIPSARAELVLAWVALVQSSSGARVESIRLIWLGNGDQVAVHAVFAHQS